MTQSRIVSAGVSPPATRIPAAIPIRTDHGLNGLGRTVAVTVTSR